MLNIAKIVEPVVVTAHRRDVYHRFVHVFIELLEQYGIRYFAHSGTMLGCIRHKGFIPWDDDVDFMIPEEDVQKLIKICLLYTSPSPRDQRGSRMPSSA